MKILWKLFKCNLCYLLASLEQLFKSYKSWSEFIYIYEVEKYLN
jgi:hypothetical protein